MCGIAGIVGFRDDSLIDKMCQSIKHRGPDSIGTFFTKNVSLGHSRLSIIDLNKIANQPMATEDKNFHIVYNGEVYNFLEIKSSLIKKGYSFKSKSDSEVVLYAYVEWGPDCLNKLNGMFAFAIHDKSKDLVFLARDRVGIKPLYYYSELNRTIFASEIKSILNYDNYDKQIDSYSLQNLFQFRYTPNENSLFKNIKKFPAGYYGIIKNGIIKKYKYWDIEDYNHEKNIYSSDSYYEKFSFLLEDSVKKRLVSDVPFGMYLSGGIDSTVILSIMNKFNQEKINTYSIDFIPPIGEAKEAKSISSNFDTNHHEISISEKDLCLLPEIINFLDEPQGDAIVLPSYKLSKESSKNVKMVLTGEGADEILTGYQFYKSIHYTHKFNYLTGLIRTLIKLSPNFLMNWLSNHPGNFQEKSKNRIINILFNNRISYIEKVNGLISLFDNNDISKLMIRSTFETNINYSDNYSLEKLQKYIFKDWLPNNILWRQDRMTMANSIEGRVPFLDHRLVEFAFSLPQNLKMNKFIDKFILRKYCNTQIKFYNSSIRKKPFYIPLDYYMKTDTMNDFIGTYLKKERIEQSGILNWNFVKDSMKNKDKTDFLYSKQLFSILMFQMWYEKHFNNK